MRGSANVPVSVLQEMVLALRVFRQPVSAHRGNYDALFGHIIRSAISTMRPVKIRLSWKVPMRVFIVAISS
jgi:hypothetical protein